MTVEEQDAYFADGLDPVGVLQVQKNSRKTGVPVMPSKGGAVDGPKTDVSGVKDQDMASQPEDASKEVKEIPSKEDGSLPSLSKESGNMEDCRPGGRTVREIKDVDAVNA